MSIDQVNQQASELSAGQSSKTVREEDSRATKGLASMLHDEFNGKPRDHVATPSSNPKLFFVLMDDFIERVEKS